MKLLKFETATCPKCAVVSNFLMQQSVTFDVIDAEKKREMANSYQIMSVPTTILIADDRTELARSIGVNPTELMNMVHTFKKGER
ncbi:thioredoxin family protein [Aquibacillus saliphilus]|uniref:thioredoxin family protein n=1 Tax=Aquibacillus saliphilus TaxID=1909422 RepID=UPI001CF09924|nr:thioredoxin family protein [Aquibacillus saliphilus]